MTIRAEIIGSDLAPAGWVEVDPIDYEYTGADPDGEVVAYLERVKNGTRSFDWPVEDDVNYDDEYPPDLILVAIKSEIQALDPVWYLDLPSDFEVTSIEYGAE
ncbi:hypothetical protein [Natronomonas gomsonensis]|uniref:hypothetical protein n=1 Tax=Natronomonas gomsonensis TaxID=1046043 RepID=UPI0015BDD172|nr:hypothetical protein [Natronomonas gomsonensis]